jgi:hypothetical protein
MAKRLHRAVDTFRDDSTRLLRGTLRDPVTADDGCALRYGEQHPEAEAAVRERKHKRSRRISKLCQCGHRLHSVLPYSEATHLLDDTVVCGSGHTRWVQVAPRGSSRAVRTTAREPCTGDGEDGPDLLPRRRLRLLLFSLVFLQLLMPVLHIDR